MSNESNRTTIVLLAAAVIVVMGIVVFLAWAADSETVGRLGDFVEYLDEHRDNASRLILTLGGLVVMVLALLLIIVELAPEEATRELKVQQAGTTTVVPAEALRQRLEEALVTLPSVTAARARVSAADKGVAASLELTLTPDANVGLVTQDATRIVVDTIQTDLGLPVAAPPDVRIAFGPAKAEPVASSIVQRPEEPAPEPPVGYGPRPPTESDPEPGAGQGAQQLPPTETSVPQQDAERPLSADDPSSEPPFDSAQGRPFGPGQP